MVVGGGNWALRTLVPTLASSELALILASAPHRAEAVNGQVHVPF